MTRLLIRLGRLLHNEIDEPLQESLGLGIKELLVLISISEGQTSPGVIAARQYLPAATVTRLITRLQEHGFLERQSDPDDLRRFRLVLTGRGTAALQRRRDETRRVLAARYAHLPPEVVAQAVEALRALEGHLQGEVARV